MKYRRYHIMKIAQRHDDKLGQVWAIIAKPIDLDPSSNTGFAETDLYSMLDTTETFLVPCQEEVIHEIMNIAQSNQLWSPDIEDWNVEDDFYKENDTLTIVHRYNRLSIENQDNVISIPEDDVIVLSSKPLKQEILEQNAVMNEIINPNTGKPYFVCGSTRGSISPAATKKLEDKNSTVDDFEIALISIKGGSAIPWLVTSKELDSQYVGNTRQNMELLYKSLLKIVEKNYKTDTLADFDLINASFVFDVLDLLKIQHGKTLGFYRRQDDIIDRSFVAAPYVHNTDADKVYNPIITPKKKTLFQRLGMSSEPYKEGDFTISESYSTEYLLRGIVDRRVLKDIIGGSNLRIDQYISLPIKEEAVWQMFLLDNIEYFLPKFDHGAYKDRKLIFTSNDTKDLPASIQQYVQRNDNKINPIIQINEAEELASVQCTYFNKWRGLVKWTCYYHLFGGHDKSLIRMSNIKHMETNDILVKYDCGIRY